MSFQAMTWATAQKLQCNQKMVLLMLANRTNHDTGRCDPSHKRLAEDCGLAVATVKRAITALEEAGLIQVIRRTREGVNLPNQYQLNMEGVGSERAEGSAQRELGVGSQRATNQELNQELKPIGGEPPASPVTGKPKTSPRPACRLPDDFAPNDTNRRIAGEVGVSLHDELEQFRDYHLAKGSRMVDWNRALNTWLRNARRFNTNSPLPARTVCHPLPANPHGDF